MGCALSSELIDRVIGFHGHSCPGLAIGIRAAEFALGEFSGPDVELVAVTETDMCGVDAIQYLTGCTYGKGNFIHRDYGKMAFSFYDRKTGRAFRLVLKPESRKDIDNELTKLMAAVVNGTATEEEKQRCTVLREKMQHNFMELPIETLFDISTPDAQAPRPPRVLQSLKCEQCGEMTMESRTRRFAGQVFCIPCFSEIEQKV